MSTREHVARYYDRNTSRFIRFGGGEDALAIHRELWGPGVTSVTDAKRYVNRLLGDEIGSSEVDTPTVLDLGCGVGGTMFELAVRFPGAWMYGVTISRAQKKLAEAWAHRLGVGDRCAFHVGDFHDPRLRVPMGTGSSPRGPEARPGELHGDTTVRASVVIAVESFAHATDPSAFFRTAARHLDADGRLFVVDDFLAIRRGELIPSDAARVDRFEEGWRLGTLLTPDEAGETARAAGLLPTGEVDLTHLIRLGRPRDHLISVVAPVLARLGLVGVPFCGNMIGGNALQDGLRRGVLSYRMLTFTPRPG
jgi:SAM-dependent methyltransferase